MEWIERPLFANVVFIINKLWIDGRKLVLQQSGNIKMQITFAHIHGCKYICMWTMIEKESEIRRGVWAREFHMERQRDREWDRAGEANLHKLHTVEKWRVKFSIIYHTQIVLMVKETHGEREKEPDPVFGPIAVFAIQCAYTLCVARRLCCACVYETDTT